MPRPDGKAASDLIARHSAFVAKCEQAQREGGFDFIERNMDKLEAIVAGVGYSRRAQTS